jgi:hypothetical protein
MHFTNLVKFILPKKNMNPSSFYIEDARKKARLISGILKENTKK